MDYESRNVKPQEITHVNEVCEKQVLGYLPLFVWGPLEREKGKFKGNMEMVHQETKFIVEVIFKF